MADESLHVPDRVTCEKCKYNYKSAVTVFAAKDVTYESKCPQCSNVNKKELKKETILSVTNSDNKAPSPPTETDIRVPAIFRDADIKGLYISVGAVCGYLLAWILQWIADDGNSFIHNTGVFLEKLAIPVFGLGLALLLFAVAIGKRPE